MAEKTDYVLVHSKDGSEDPQNEEKRKIFEDALRKERFTIEEFIGDKVFKKLHCQFERLCEEAERVKLEMPLEETDHILNNIDISDKGYVERGLLSAAVAGSVFTSPSPQGIQTGLRAIAKDNKANTGTAKEHQSFDDYCWFLPCDRGSSDESTHSEGHDARTLRTVNVLLKASGIVSYFTGAREWNRLPLNAGLQYLLEEKVYEDAFILHEDSSISIKKKRIWSKTPKDKEKSLSTDPRKEMDKTWRTWKFWTKSFWKFQPLWKVRNYFGEKIALYFAWAGLLLTTLLGPAVFGLACFIYGLPISLDRANEDIQIPANLTAADQFHWKLKILYEIVRGSFDNDLTPWFALVICLWGTVFLELWKRKNAVLAYKWHVVNYEANEPDRPKANVQSPAKQCCMKFLLWTSTLIVMLLVVVISVVTMGAVRLGILIRYCGETATMNCSLSSIILPGIGNAVFIVMIMGWKESETDAACELKSGRCRQLIELIKCYDRLARILTQYENHDTQTEHDDALIFKLFAFQFANNYASCFYIAFFRGEIDVFGLIGFGEEYSDVCYRGSCMSQLSIQVLILMVSKPIGKLFKDVIWPPIKDIICPPIKDTIWPKIKFSICGKCSENKIGDEENNDQSIPENGHDSEFIDKNYNKVPLGDFTLEEYAEKVILYGFLMLFASASPLAPLIALGWLVVDMALDVQRLLWLTRRPVAAIAQDIGTWYDILNFVNVLGVISNGFLIAFKSQWGLQFDLTTRMWICIGFQNIVFALKFFLDYIIPDVPKEVTRAIRRDKSRVSKELKDSSEEDGKQE